MIIITTISVLLGLFSSSNQHTIEHDSAVVHFSFTINDQPLILNETIYSAVLKDSVSIEKVKFYISNIEINNELVNEQNYLLLDASKPESLHFPLEITSDLKSISFTLGVDSMTNSSGAHGGHLDPMNGMYWSWQSGYINFKLEGDSPVCSSRNNEFTFHLGGYSESHNALQHIILPILNEQDSLKIILPLDKLLAEFNLSENHGIMSPSEEAVKLSELVANTFILAD